MSDLRKDFSLQAQLRTLGAWAALTILPSTVAAAFQQASYASASETVSLASNVVRSAAESNWQQSPSSALNSAGKNSVSLNSCPPGVSASEPWYYVYISGTGGSEAVEVTGGTCKGDGRPGTLEFVSKHSHPPGYEIGSASAGVQEASIAARFTPTNPLGVSQSGRVVIPPGEYDVFAPISIQATGQTIDFEAAILNCYTRDGACLFVGDHKSANNFGDITLVNPRGRPMIAAGTKPFIEVNSQHTRIFNVTARRGQKDASFGSYVQVDDDQAFLLDGLDSSAGGITCNPGFCGAFITAPGPFNLWSAVGWLKHLNLSMQCVGNGVNWLSGNGLRISDSVIEGWSVYGVRVSNQRGGFGGFVSDNVYYEASDSCKDKSPYGNVGNSAILAEGVEVKISGVANNGASGDFPNWGASSGTHDWLYWVVPVHATFGDGIPLPAGFAKTSGSRNIIGTFPRIAGASSYKILRMDWDQKSTRPFPAGTGNYLVATVQQSSCATLICQFLDLRGTPASYTVVGTNLSSNFYMPRLDFWPGAIVISSAADMSTASYQTMRPPLQADILGAGAIVSTIPPGAVTGVANTLVGTTATPPAAANLEAISTGGADRTPGATILKAANGPQTAENGMKGRLNFGHAGRNAEFTPLITLGDSNWGKTWATANHRPKADVNDLDLGYEGDIDTLYSRAQHEIREYVGKFPDHDPQERLTASSKTFNVPVTVNGDLHITGKCVGCGSRKNAVGVSESEAASLTGQSAALTTRSLCAATVCKAGQYRISYYLTSTNTCAAVGRAAVGLTISWKDEAGSRSMKVPLSGSGVSADNNLSLGSSDNFATGDLSIWSGGEVGISYSTSYVGCNSGAGAYALHIVAEKLQ
ncbi:MAG TPA: hypothetical protein VGS27_09050 [Candidatus Sulfotelmatobacter sp.]|nr:hypothetical protein [Candidatus Sulfotelmatobacter sp.]